MFRCFRYFGLFVSVVTVVSFRWFRFDVSGFSPVARACCMTASAVACQATCGQVGA